MSNSVGLVTNLTGDSLSEMSAPPPALPPPPVDYRARQVPDCPDIARETLSKAALFPNPANPSAINLSLLRDHLLREGKISKEAFLHLINLAAEIFRKEPNVLTLTGETRVCGDLHGQYYDFLKLLEVGGDPATPQCTYLFMGLILLVFVQTHFHHQNKGDYVDRGSFGVELIIHLFALKISFPDTFFMLRGNHESRQLTEHFNFKRECLSSTVLLPLSSSPRCVQAFTSTTTRSTRRCLAPSSAFPSLPSAATSASSASTVASPPTSARSFATLLLVTAAAPLSPPSPLRSRGSTSFSLALFAWKQVDDVNRLNRFVETPENGALWSDAQEEGSECWGGQGGGGEELEEAEGGGE